MQSSLMFPDLLTAMPVCTHDEVGSAEVNDIKPHGRFLIRNKTTGAYLGVAYLDPVTKRIRRMRSRLGLRWDKSLTREGSEILGGWCPLNAEFKWFTLVTFKSGQDYHFFRRMLKKNNYIRRLMNAWRTAYNRTVHTGIPFSYFWVLERGHQGTKRYHFHIMSNWVPPGTDNGSLPLPNRNSGLEKMWGKGWVCCETIRKPWGAAVYAAKYVSKESINASRVRGFGASTNLKSKPSDWTYEGKIKPDKRSGLWREDLPDYKIEDGVCARVFKVDHSALFVDEDAPRSINEFPCLPLAMLGVKTVQYHLPIPFTKKTVVKMFHGFKTKVAIPPISMKVTGKDFFWWPKSDQDAWDLDAARRG